MAPARRNLTLAVAASLLVHAVLLAIHFKLPETLARVTEQALDVVLVNSKHAERPRDAQVLAQTNLDAGGDTEQDHRAATPLPPSEQTHAGDDLVQAQQRVEQLETQAREAMTRLDADRAIAVNPQRRDQAPPAPHEPPGTDLYSRSLAIARLEAQIDKQMDHYNKRPKVYRDGVRAQEYLPAQYLEDWRQKVERIGNLNYPEAARGHFYGSLTVYIEINSEGDLMRAEIRRSSGQKVLDEAALRILRLAAPYGRFPPQLKEKFDILAFARVWSFTRGDQFKSQ
ncbi:MAG: TonB family protein [Proteobacteria bacterium]|nr:TonB family protein [Pseudomonadota bacterium]